MYMYIYTVYICTGYIYACTKSPLVKGINTSERSHYYCGYCCQSTSYDNEGV